MLPAVWTPLLSISRRTAGARSAPWVRRFVRMPLLVLAGLLIADSARAADEQRTVTAIPVPGGLRGALATLDDSVPADRAQFLLEFIRRFYQSPIGAKNDPREAVLRSLLAYLDRGASAQTPGTDTIPLPLTPEIWTKAVFGGRVSSANLLAGILRTRNTSLLYYGLMALDDRTRAWIGGRPDLLGQIVTRHAAAFATVAAGLRVDANRIRVPGGEAAEPVWQALTGRRPDEPVDFVRALFTQGEGRLALVYATLAELPAPTLRFVLNLDAPDVGARVDAGRRVFGVFERLTPMWSVEDRTFARPLFDPALLAADLHAGADGRPNLPGTRRFWTMVFADPDQPLPKGRADDPADGASADFAWICEEIFSKDHVEQRRRYYAVLFASRTLRDITPATAGDALDAVRTIANYPALGETLERAKISDLAVFAAAARRAAQLSGISDDSRADRALAQFQGALALATRAALRGGVSAEALPRLVASLSAVEVNTHGDYEGRLVRWIDAFTGDGSPSAAAPIEPATYDSEVYDEETAAVDRAILHVVSGLSAVREPRFVDWEGTRYRLDFAAAEAVRLAHVLGTHPRPYLTSARTLVGIADSIEATGGTQATLRRNADLLEGVGQSVEWTTWQGGDAPSRYKDATTALGRAAHDGDLAGARALAPALRLLADDLLARGLMEITYATALGQPDGVTILAGDAAARHEFGARTTGARRAAAWRLPLAGAGTSRGWHVAGSLLGLDASLGDFALIRLSAKPPSKRPTLNEDDRRAFTESVPLANPLAMPDATAAAIVEAMKKGRATLEAMRTPAQALALADDIHLGAARRTLLAWIVEHDPGHAAAFLSPVELLWAGLETRPLDPAMQAWGTSGVSRLGCLCVQLMDRRPWEYVGGRWSSGLFASAFPDLTLRLAELLADLHMPAPLLAPVLAAATLDFVNGATSRDQDDRRGLVEYVRALRVDRVEQYLALLTTDGPLLPVSQTAQPTTAKAGVSR